jgi:hypothetical protein
VVTSSSPKTHSSATRPPNNPAIRANNWERLVKPCSSSGVNQVNPCA